MAQETQARAINLEGCDGEGNGREVQREGKPGMLQSMGSQRIGHD